MAYEVRIFSEANDGRFFVWFSTSDKSDAADYAARLQERRRRNQIEVAEVGS